MPSGANVKRTTDEIEILLESSPYFGHMRELVEQEFSRYRSVLDLGCGPGLRDLRLLEEMGIPRLVGIDVGCTLDPLVKRDSIDYVSADIESSHLPIADESFDLVIMDNVIEHMYDPRRVLME